MQHDSVPEGKKGFESIEYCDHLMSMVCVYNR